MSKTFGIAKKVLGDPKENEEFVKNKINCEGQPDPNSPISNIDYNVLYPSGLAKEENVVTLRGGSVIKVSLNKEIEGGLDSEEKDKVEKFIKGVALPRSQNQFSDDVSSPTEYIRKITLKINKLLLNISEQSKDLEEMGSYYISGYKSNPEDQDVRDFTDFKNYLDLSRFRNRKIKRVFRFGFIPFEVFESILNQVADKASSVNYKVLNKIDPKDIKQSVSDINENTTQEEIDEAIKNTLSFLCPVHKLSFNDINSSDDTSEQIGYYTYYNKTLYFMIPDMSLEDANGSSPNFYNLGETKENFRYYMALEAVMFSAISYTPISYMPPPSPILQDNIIEEIQSSGSFAIDFSKDGLVGGTTEHFGFKIPNPKYSDYKIIISPQSSSKASFFKLGIESANNDIEYFSYPNIAVNSFFVDVEENFQKIKELFTSPSVTSQLKDFLGTEKFEEEFLVNNSFDDKKIESFVNKNGIPSFASKSSLGFKNNEDYFGILNRPDFIISNFKDNLKKNSNDKKIYRKKLSSSSSLFSFATRNYLDETLVPEKNIQKSFKDLNPTESQTVSSREGVISVDSGKDFSLYVDQDLFGGMDLNYQRNFVIYVSDKYGQLVRVPFGSVTMQKDRPEITSITPNGFPDTEVVFTDDFVTLSVEGDSLLNITSFKFFSSPDSLVPYATFQVGDPNVVVTKNSFDKFNFSLVGTYEELVTSNIGPVWIQLVNKNSLGSSLNNRSSIYLSSIEVEEITEDDIPEDLVNLNPDSIRMVNDYNVPLLLNDDSSNHPILKLKSKDKVFKDGDIFSYIAAEIGTQSEEDIIKIFEEFSFKEDIYIARNIASGDGDKSYVITSSVKYSINTDSFYAESKRLAKIIFPGEEFIGYNLSSLDKLSKPIMLFLNREIEEFGSNGVNLNTDNIANSYSVVTLGNEEKSAFSKPPSIRNIIIKNTDSSKLLTSSVLSEKISKVLSGENSAGKVVFSKSELSSANIGSKVHASKNPKRIVVIIEGSLTKRGFSEYKVSIGDNSFGFGTFDKIKAVNFDTEFLVESFQIVENGIKKDIIVFALDNITIDNDGSQSIVVTRKDRRFKTKYDSRLFYSKTITSYSFELNEEGSLVYSGESIPLGSPLFEKETLPVSKELSKDLFILSSPISYTPSADLGVFAARFIEGFSSKTLKQFYEYAEFYEFNTDGEITNTPLEAFGSIESLQDNFSISDQALPAINLPEVSIGSSSDVSLDGFAEAEAFANGDAANDPLSSRNVLGSKALESEEDAEKILKDEPNLIIGFENISFYLVKGLSSFDSTTYISKEVVPSDYPEVKLEDNDDLIVTLYKSFLRVEVNYTSNILVNMPTLIGMTKNGEKFQVDDLGSLTIEVEDTLELEYENIFDEDFKLEINKKRVDPSDVKIDVNGNGKITYEVSQELADLSFEAFQLGDPCFEVSLSTTNSLHFNATKVLGNGLALNLANRSDSLYNGGFLNDKKDGKDWSNLALQYPIKWSQYVADKSQTLLELRDSFCDLSFSITGQFSAYLSGFKNILVIIKVIFCIIDVICALLNPVKLAFATIRLFSCLYDLLLLLPQIAIPVALLTLSLHLVELLKCVIEKILYTINAINEISAALDKAVLNKDLEAVMNLEKVLSEYILDLETDLQVLDPIVDILNIFLELLQVFFAFPCSPGEGSSDEFRECQLDSSLVSGIILSKVNGESGEGLSKENLLPVAQAYTTLPIDSMGSNSQCGNSPPGLDNENLTWMGDCNFESDVLREPSDYIGASVANKNPDNDGFLDRTTVNSNSFRTSNFDANGGTSEFESIGFEATYGVSFTKSTKNPSNLTEAFIKGPDPRRVTFQFDSKGITNPLGYVSILGAAFAKKVVNENQSVDTPFKLFEKEESKVKISESISKNGFISPIDGFDGFLEGDISTGLHPAPLTVEFSTDDDGVVRTWQRTFQDLPMVAIVDDSFNVYFINKNGIRIDPESGAISSIEARIINTGSAPKRGITKDDEEVVKNEYVLAGQANYNWVISLPNAPEIESLLPTSRYDEAHNISQEELKQLAFEWGDWTNFEDEYEQQVPFMSAKDEEGNLVSVGSYDYAGGNIFDKTKLSNAIDQIKVFDFPQLYFVDVRQVADELQSACTISDINSILLGGPSNEEVADSVKEVLNCVGKFRGFMQKEIDGLKDKVNNGEVPGLISVEEVQNQYTAFVNCLNDSIDRSCNIVVNPYNTSFLLSNDISKNETDYFDPSGLDSDVLEFAAGLRENFDGPSITGASEYASGIGSSVTAKINEEIEIMIIPRDSYDNIIENLDFEEKINIQIVSDETGEAKVKTFNYNGGTVFVEKNENGNGYRAVIQSPFPGKIEVKASICSKVVKAFTYSNVIEIGGSEFEDQDCVPDSEPIIQEDLPLGSLIEVDRILIINVEDENVFLGIQPPDAEDVALDPQTSPQVKGTKLEN